MARVEKQSEAAAVDEVAKRLRAKYPKVNREHIEQLVRAEYDRMLEAKLRDYIPVLVEHQVKQQLRHERDA
jgi:hypothetical protein